MDSPTPTPAHQAPLNSRTAVIVCDDHVAVRSGLMAILEERGIEVIGECDSVFSLTKLVHRHPDAVAIVDLGMNDVPLRDMMERLREQAPACKVVVYSMREAPGTMRVCYEAGALAFVPKRADPDELVRAVECANSGERYFPPSVASELANFQLDAKAPGSLLSARELEIFVAYASRETVEALALRLGISDRSVNNALSRIAKKLDVPRSAFSDIARRYGLTEPH